MHPHEPVEVQYVLHAEALGEGEGLSLLYVNLFKVRGSSLLSSRNVKTSQTLTAR